MKGAIPYGPRDLRFEEREAPKIEKATDAIIRISATCVCGSGLWPYRGIQPVAQPPMEREFCGIVEEVGSAVKSVKPGQFVISSFFASDSTCPNCTFGYPSSCGHREFVGTAQALRSERDAFRRIDLVWNKTADFGKVFDLTVPRSGRGGLPRDGRAAGDQDAAVPAKASTRKESLK
jgi:threonine dehydrogenase-like Zn-dependent dehydrogenase